jgi:hypothetical protein
LVPATGFLKGFPASTRFDTGLRFEFPDPAEFSRIGVEFDLCRLLFSSHEGLDFLGIYFTARAPAMGRGMCPEL